MSETLDWQTPATGTSEGHGVAFAADGLYGGPISSEDVISVQFSDAPTGPWTNARLTGGGGSVQLDTNPQPFSTASPTWTILDVRLLESVFVRAAIWPSAAWIGGETTVDPGGWSDTVLLTIEDVFTEDSPGTGNWTEEPATAKSWDEEDPSATAITTEESAAAGSWNEESPIAATWTERG